MMLRAIACAAALCALVYSGSTQAATMTFTGLPGYDDISEPWVEDGITAIGIGGDLAARNTPGIAHMDPSGTGFARTLNFTMAGYFNPVSLDILGGSLTSYCTFEPEVCGLPYDNVRIAGFRDGALVAEDIFFRGDMASNTYLFSDSFVNLDSFLISALDIEDWVTGWCYSECSHFNVDNVTLSFLAPFDPDPSPVTPVPIPPSALLLLSAIGLIAWRGKVLKRPSSLV